tara:strand:+ start:703 stop:864 length:162 start_codon:yes stop_codon:yes gene_type:complete
MFGKKKKKLEGQAFIDFYEKKLKDTGKTTLGEKARYIKEKSKLRNKLIKSGGN